jgi:hypothetical protein
MAMNLADIRSYVRSHLDLDEEDLPNTLLDVFIREGSKRIEQAEKRWPFYEQTYEFTTTADQSDYEIADIASDINEIVAMRGPRWEMRWIGRDEGDARFPRNIDNNGEPVWFSIWADTIRLFPTPDESYTIIVRAYRKPVDWVALGAGEEPDLPDELHNTVAMWALARAYGQQDDPELAAFYERQFADEMMLFRRRFVDAPPPSLMQLNGGGRVTRLSRMRFDWD